MSQYIYQDILTAQDSEYIRGLIQEYPYPVEILKMPEEWFEWQKDGLLDYQDFTENCMGQLESRKTKKYGLLRRKGGGTTFLFFGSVQEKEKFIRDFSDLIVSPWPFKTVI